MYIGFGLMRQYSTNELGKMGFFVVPSRFMRKIVCRLRLNEVSRQ